MISRLCALFLFVVSLSTHAEEAPPRIQPTSQLALSSTDGVLLRGEVYEFERKFPVATVIVLPALGTTPRSYGFFLEEVKNLGFRFVFLEPRGIGGSVRHTDGTSFSWRSMTPGEKSKMIDDIAQIAELYPKTPIALIGIEFSATLAVLASKKVKAQALVLISPEERIHGLECKPSDIFERSSIFAATGPESPRHYEILDRWRKEFPSAVHAPQVFMETGLGSGYSLLRYSTKLRRSIWTWLSRTMRNPS